MDTSIVRGIIAAYLVFTLVSAANAEILNTSHAAAPLPEQETGTDWRNDPQTITGIHTLTLEASKSDRHKSDVSQVTVTTYIQPASHAGRGTRIYFQVQGDGVNEAGTDFLMRVRVSAEFQPRYLAFDDDAISDRLHIIADGMYSDHDFDSGSNSTSHTVYFVVQSILPGPRAISIELIPGQDPDGESQVVQTHSWFEDQYDKPDLWCDVNLTWPEGRLYGWSGSRKNDLIARVRNTGKQASPKCRAFYYITEEDEFSTATANFLRSYKIPSLEPGEEHIINGKFPFRKVDALQSIWVQLDADNRVDEGNETNNVMGKIVVVK